MKRIINLLFILFCMFVVNPTKAQEVDFIGIGAQLYKPQNPKIIKNIVITSVIPNSPAQKAGIKIADQILEIDDIDTSGLTLEQATSLLKGEVGETVKLKILGENGIKELNLKRAEIDSSIKLPQWKDICSDKPSKGEACFLHKQETEGKKAQKITLTGNIYAIKRYEFEKKLNSCAEDKNPSLCYIQIEQDFKTNAEKLSAKATINVAKKDPKLIILPKTKNIDEKAYNQKVLADNKTYENYKKNIDKEYYNLYLILDKLLRANNLYYLNWRVVLKNDIQDINAASSAINLITINTSLYDSLGENKDALAFVLSHELAHFLLGHHQISVENYHKIKQLEIRRQRALDEAKRQRDLSSINNAIGNGYASMGNSFSSLGYTLDANSIQKAINQIYEQERRLEFQADAEALSLMARGGFDITKGEGALSFLSNMPNIQTNKSSHPDMQTRIEKFHNEANMVNLDDLKKQGRNNIYNSKVLEVKKSSDKKSMVISNVGNSKNITYIPETTENKLLKRAYQYYLEDDMGLAKIYFKNVFVENPSNYVAALYLSYIYEYEFLYNNNKKNLKQARYWIKKAQQYNQNNKSVIKQQNDITNLIKKVKSAQKKA